MSSLNKKEIVGFISLAIIVVAILLVAFILRRTETDSSQTPELKPTVLTSGSEEDDGDVHSSSRFRKNTRKKHSSKSSRSSSKKEKEPIIEYDPFSDTIPVDFDDY